MLAHVASHMENADVLEFFSIIRILRSNKVNQRTEKPTRIKLNPSYSMFKIIDQSPPLAIFVNLTPSELKFIKINQSQSKPTKLYQSQSESN